ncbi:MAG: PqqD family protein [Oscillospiraceae bacterium]|nr:PqqD family protein [Oscillospiraceae bacterium]
MLNETGAFLFRFMQEDTDRATLLHRLEEEYEAPEAQLRADLESFLSQMREAGLLEEAV